MEIPDGRSYQSSPQKSYDDVAWVVNTKIETGPTVDERPDNHCNGDQPTAEEKCKENGEAERVGCMGREESEASSAIAIDDVDEYAYLRVAGWSPTSKERLDEHIIDAACKEDAKQCADDDEDDFAHIIAVLDNDIEQSNIERYPCCGSSQRLYDRVEKD